MAQPRVLYGKRPRSSVSGVESSVRTANKRNRMEWEEGPTAFETPEKQCSDSPVKVNTTLPREALLFISPVDVKVADCSTKSIENADVTRTSSWSSQFTDRSKRHNLLSYGFLKSHTSSLDAGEPTRIKAAHTLVQTYLDLGQRNGDSKLCKRCGMIFAPGDIIEEKSHEKFCKEESSKSSLVLPRVARRLAVTEVATATPGEFFECVGIMPTSTTTGTLVCADDVKIVVYLPGDPPQRARIEMLETCLKNALGDRCCPFERCSKHIIYWCAVLNSKVIGILVTERLDSAYEVIPGDSADIAAHTDLAIPMNEEVAQPAALGVAQIWVHPDHRNKHLATLLLDAARAGAVYGCHIPLSQVAFSQPTRAGAALARSYTGRERFLAYA